MPEETDDFTGRVAVVTGGASGIGAACSAAFARRGARVAIWDINRDAGTRLAEELGAAYGSGSVRFFATDVSEQSSVTDALAGVQESLGPVDHLVNSAVNFVAAGRDAGREQWERAFGVNVIGPAMLTAAVAESMAAGSTVVNISSISAHVAQPDRWTYNACKAAILALTRCQALDFRSRGIRVNSVSPGWVWTPEVEKAAGDQREVFEPLWSRYHILERLGEAPEIADAVLYLSSDRATFITGTELFVDGGYSAIGPEGLGDTAKFAGTDEPA